MPAQRLTLEERIQYATRGLCLYMWPEDNTLCDNAPMMAAG